MLILKFYLECKECKELHKDTTYDEMQSTKSTIFRRTFEILRRTHICKASYRPQRSWGKVIFSQACVIVFTGGFASVHAGIPPPPWTRHTAQTRHTPQTRHPLDQAPPRPGTPLGADTHPAQSILGDMVNAWVVRILLECNLVVV